MEYIDKKRWQIYNDSKDVYKRQLLEYGLTQCVYSLEYAAALSTEAKRCGGVLQAHIKVDTGMSLSLIHI